jgi:putative spermidine/putrescine transport system permease protein
MSLSRIVLYVAVGLILIWLMIPVLIIIPMSFSGARFLAFPPPSWSFRWYEAYLQSAAWMQATRVSLILAVSSAIIATVLGTAAAYALNLSTSRIVRSLQVVLLLPLVVPIVITAVGVFLVYANVDCSRP